MQLLALNLLDAHPDNANVLPRELARRLKANIAHSGRYPPLIVRPHPTAADRFQIIDGHHRARVLAELQHTHARCDVWDVDDTQTELLLATLNRLSGDDHPVKRGALLDRLSRSMDVKRLKTLLPDDAARIDRLRRLATASLPRIATRSRVEDDLPRAVTFFLSARHKAALDHKLAAVDAKGDRSAALVALLDLDASSAGSNTGTYADTDTLNREHTDDALNAN